MGKPPLEVEQVTPWKLNSKSHPPPQKKKKKWWKVEEDPASYWEFLVTFQEVKLAVSTWGGGGRDDHSASNPGMFSDDGPLAAVKICKLNIGFLRQADLSLKNIFGNKQAATDGTFRWI